MKWFSSAPTLPTLLLPLAGAAAAFLHLSSLAQAPLPTVRTQHGIFQPVDFSELPGWAKDDPLLAWDALLTSCTVLRRRPTWVETCAAAQNTRKTQAEIRRFFEARFVPLQILNPDTSPEGMVTGYFEPLLAGRLQREPGFDFPVHGVPDDLLTLDWSVIPQAQRKGVVWLRRDGQRLLPAQPGPSSIQLDLGQFELDTKDRRLRVRLDASTGSTRALPYPTREEIEIAAYRGRSRAPVLAWVSDALALYSMQIQGSGRIRLQDGQVLRLQFGEHNGRPFKPLRVVQKPRTATLTRSLGGDLGTDEFELEEATTPSAATAPPAGVAPGLTPAASSSAERAPAMLTPPTPDETATRGLRPRTAPRPVAAPAQPAVDDVVAALLGNKRAPPSAAAGAIPAPVAGSTGGTAGRSGAKNGSDNVGASATKPADTQGPATLLHSDPSYVFFRPAPDQASTAGPAGALGVPLTPGRSVAIDPRITPLGYPVFLDAPAPTRSAVHVQRLVFAQDTGGAIRGAVRADFFWGFGADAGQLARGTRHTGRMWLLMPHDELKRLTAGTTRTRSLSGNLANLPTCLVVDEFCGDDK